MRPNSAQMHTVRMPHSSFSGYRKSWRIWSSTMILSVDRSFENVKKQKLLGLTKNYQFDQQKNNEIFFSFVFIILQ